MVIKLRIFGHFVRVCILNLLDSSPPFEIEITLPHSYPHSELRLQACVRGVPAPINKSLQEFINSLQQNYDLGTYCISFVVEYLLERLGDSCEESVVGDTSNKVRRTHGVLQCVSNICSYIV